MKRLKITCFIIFVLFTFTTLAQTGDLFSQGRPHKGHFYFYWGYNWDAYSKSNIHFKGPQYDFVLKDVVARDRQEKFTLKNYFALENISIPQYNYRLGYWLTNDMAISIGLDHMKYVVVQDQTVGIEGHINPRGNYQKHSTFSDGDEVTLTKDFLQYEHTDGLNYLSVELDKLFWTYPFIPQKIEASVLGSVGVGAYIPRTDVRLFGEGINNKFHISGWGASAMAGVHIEFWRILFLRAGFKTGYVGLLDVLTTGESYDQSKQHFVFYQLLGVIGANFRVFKLKDESQKRKL